MRTAFLGLALLGALGGFTAWSRGLIPACGEATCCGDGQDVVVASEPSCCEVDKAALVAAEPDACCEDDNEATAAEGIECPLKDEKATAGVDARSEEAKGTRDR